MPGEPNERPRLEPCWGRRYCCLRCERTFFVLPPGVVPRFLYCMAAIVWGWFLVGADPVGEGLTDADAYRRQGAFRPLRWRDEATWRWRSLSRWFQLAPRWWPHRVVHSVEALLLSFVAAARSTDRRAAVERAIASRRLAGWAV